MKKYFYIIILLAVSFQTSSFAQNNGAGIGIIIGEPTGLSGKYWTSNSTAFDAGLAWSFVDDNAFQLHADYLFHNFNLISVPDGKLPFYFGIGARLKTANDLKLGVRVPLGLSYHFQNEPIDIFLEVVPVLDFTPKTDFFINAAIGARYYFNTH